MTIQESELISVIVPVYKVEKYLPSCIDSILAQTYRNMEVILVDDGSPDLCPMICDEYRKRDERIRVIHKTNGGLSDARNAGMRESTADLIAFIDSDDYIEDTYIERLYQALTENNADIAICDYRNVAENTVYQPTHAEETGEVKITRYNNTECLKALYSPRTHGMEFLICGKLFRKRLFTENQIVFPVGRIHEDTFTTYRLVYSASTIVFVDLPNYCYRIRAGSIMRNQYDPRHFDLILAKREECYFFMARDRELFNCAVNSFFKSSVFLYLKLNGPGAADDREKSDSFLGEYREDCKNLLLKSDLPLFKKIFYTLFAYSFVLRYVAAKWRQRSDWNR